MFGQRSKQFSQFLRLHGFQAVDRGVYVRIFHIRSGQVMLEIKFDQKISIVTTGAARQRTETFSWRDINMVKIIIDQDSKRLQRDEDHHRFAQGAGPGGTYC